jgi:hypothetical protein
LLLPDDLRKPAGILPKFTVGDRPSSCRWSATANASNPLRYDTNMKTVNTKTILGRLVDGLADCFTPGSARRLLAFKTDRIVQARVDYLAGRCNEGMLTPEERAEYESFVRFNDIVAILQAKARQLIKSQGRQKKRTKSSERISW